MITVKGCKDMVSSRVYFKMSCPKTLLLNLGCFFL